MRHRLNLLLCMWSVCLCSCFQEDIPSSGKELQVGDAMPAFEVELRIPDPKDWRHASTTIQQDSNSTMVRTQEMRGRTIVLSFFHTDCEDCRRELPQLQQHYERLRSDSHYAFLCIAREEASKDIEAYWQQHSLTLPFSAQTDRKVYNLFATTGIPQLYLINEQGIIVKHETDVPSMAW